MSKISRSVSLIALMLIWAIPLAKAEGIDRKAVVSRVQLHGGGLKARFLHAGGDEAAPDQLIQAELIAA